jgi:hypothetical protein
MSLPIEWAWARPGTIVIYSPHAVPGAPSYLGVIASNPRELGATWVVRLERMELAYSSTKAGLRSAVAAAAVHALRPVGTMPEGES